MKKFKFRLEPLLRYRSFLEDQAKLEVARVRHEVLECEQKITRMQDDYKAAFLNMNSEAGTGIDAGRYSRFSSYLIAIEQQVENEEFRKMELEQVLYQKQEVLTKKTIDRKAMENLKERRKKEYYSEMMKAEQKDTDDIIIVRKARELNQW
jgi:flagellar protein FliJ